MILAITTPGPQDRADTRHDQLIPSCPEHPRFQIRGMECAETAHKNPDGVVVEFRFNV